MQKVILVTGASSGLGKEISEFLSKEYVVYGGFRNLNNLDSVGSVTPIKLDITSETDCKSAIEQIVKKEGRLDVLINAAGYTVSGPSIDFSAADFQEILETNAVGAFRLMKYVVPQMKNQKTGYVINITSLNGLVSLPNFGLYSASKHALEALGAAMHYELKKFGINIVNLAPGAIYSESAGKTVLKHKPAREKFKILYYLMPMVTKKQIAEKIEKIIKLKNPPVEVVMGNDTLITTTIRRFLPSFVWEKIMNLIWSKK